jgi:hypothetical protein
VASVPEYCHLRFLCKQQNRRLTPERSGALSAIICRFQHQVHILCPLPIDGPPIREGVNEKIQITTNSGYTEWTTFNFCLLPEYHHARRRGQKCIGRQKTVCGTVASAHFAAKSKGQPTFINLDKPTQIRSSRGA